MMPAREIKRLVDYPYTVVRVRCRFCPHYMKGYRVARLAAKLGADIDLHALLDLLECGRGRPSKLRKLQSFCGVVFADVKLLPPSTGAPPGAPDRIFTKDGDGTSE